MTPLNVNILYEYDWENRPHGSGMLRLIRPFSYVREKINIDWGLDLNEQPADVVIVDRLWCPYSITQKKAEKLIERIRKKKAKFIYSFDDNFLDLPLGTNGYEEKHKEIFEIFLKEADGLLVTTETLRSRYIEINKNIVVLPHALDERLLVRRWGLEQEMPFPKKRVVIGYMGTYTHSQDLDMVIPAIKTILDRYPDRVEFQLIGVTNSLPDELSPGLVKYIKLDPEKVDYEHFMTWFTGNVFWDIAISPLCDTKFNHSKSDVKFLDYSAIASCAIYSKCSAYEKTVEQNVTGFMVENTESCMGECI